MEDLELQHRHRAPSTQEEPAVVGVVSGDDNDNDNDAKNHEGTVDKEATTPATNHNNDTAETPSSSSSKKRRKPLPSIFVRMPNTAFGISMGLAGNSIALKTAANASFIDDAGIDASIPNMVVWSASLLVLCSVGILYGYKLLFHFDYVLHEWRCSERTHFMNAPHLTLLMLSIGMPERMGATLSTLRILWSIAFFAQTIITQFMYEHWFFSPASSQSGSGRRLVCAKPQFLLSTVGWFLLSVLGSISGIAEAWGLALPAFCLGAGTMLYLMVVMNIFNDTSAVTRGSPALFLLIAPPSVCVVATDLLGTGVGQEFSVVSQVILGWCLVVVLLLLRLGPIIWQRPPVLGVYWAYAFPLSALATALLRYATIVDTTSSHVLAVVFLVVSLLALVVVFCRTSFHCVRCAMGREIWGDSLLQSNIMEGEEIDDSDHDE
jgi:tellurite resistance protein TehA-like permease